MAFNITNLAQAVSKCLGEMLNACSAGTRTQPTYAGEPSTRLLRTTARLLRPGGERRDEEAAREHTYERTTIHYSIT